MFAGFTVQWTDIDLYHAYRDFTTDPVSFPPEEVASFISDLVSDILRVIVRLCLIETSHRPQTTNTVRDVLVLPKIIEFSSSFSDIPIVDPGISVIHNSTDVVCFSLIFQKTCVDPIFQYDPFTRGAEQYVYSSNTPFIPSDLL